MKTKLNILGLLLVFWTSTLHAVVSPTNQPFFLILSERTNYAVEWNADPSKIPAVSLSDALSKMMPGRDSQMRGFEPEGQWRSKPIVLVRNGQSYRFQFEDIGLSNTMTSTLSRGDIICLGNKPPIDYGTNHWFPSRGKLDGGIEREPAGTNGVVIVLGGGTNCVMVYRPHLSLKAALAQGGTKSGFDETCTLVRYGQATIFHLDDLQEAKSPDVMLRPWDIVSVGRIAGLPSLAAMLDYERQNKSSSQPNFSTLLENILTGSQAARIEAESEMHLSEIPPRSTENPEFEKAFFGFMGDAIMGRSSEEQYQRYCQVIEILIEDLGHAPNMQAESDARLLLQHLTSYSAYRYESWKKSWPKVKHGFDANRAAATSSKPSLDKKAVNSKGDK